MKEHKYIFSILASVIVISLVGVFITYQSNVLGALQDRGRVLSDEYINKTLLNATSTAGNPTTGGVSRAATSTPIQIGGAEKITLELSAFGTTTAQAVDFMIYVSSDEQYVESQSPSAHKNYKRFGDLVTLNAEGSTADAYFTRTAIVTINDTGTTTVAMDLTYGAWRSMLCTASSSAHTYATCKALIEF